MADKRLRLIFYICCLFLVLSKNIKAQLNSVSTINSSPTAATTTEPDSSKCDGKCVLIVICCVIAVFVLCLIGSIYYATHQDKGQRKHQQDWSRTMRNAGKRPPTRWSMPQMDAGQYQTSTGNVGADNFGYDVESPNGSYPTEQILYDDGQDGFIHNDYPYIDRYSGYPLPPVSRDGRKARLQSAPDMYEPKRTNGLSPRAYSLDPDRPMHANKEEDFYNPNVEDLDMRYPPIAMPYIPPLAVERVYSEDGYEDEGGVVLDEEGDNYSVEYHSNTAKLEEELEYRPTKYVLKRSESFQEIPVVTDENGRNEVNVEYENEDGQSDVYTAGYEQSESDGYDPNGYDDRSESTACNLNDCNEQQETEHNDEDYEPYDEDYEPYDEDDKIYSINIEVENKNFVDQKQNDKNNNLETEYTEDSNSAIEIKVLDEDELDKSDFHRANNLMTRVTERKILEKRLDSN